jgi:glycosyltransferase involved in cell wall biosynthesis
VDAGRKVHLMLIGDGPDLPRLRGDNQHLPFVTFLGHVDQPARLFGGFDIGVFPSTFAGETFPLFLLECFGPGLPVVSTDIGEIGYIMGERKEAWPGVLVSHRQDAAAVAKGMAEAIGGIIDDPALLRRMRENALQTSDRFSMDALVALYEQAFRRLVVQTNRGAPNEQDQGEGRVLGAAA